MKLFFLVLSLIFISSFTSYAQKPPVDKFGFGFMLGSPTAATINYFTSNQNSIDAYLGNSYFGALAIGGDYLWHFNAFNSRNWTLYAGPGVVLGFGDGRSWWSKKDKDKDKWYYDREGIGLGVRGLMGISFVPRNSKFQIFFETGLLISNGVGFDSAIGFRFYP